MAKKTKDKRTHSDLQNITQAGARHLSGFLTCKVLHLSGNFILKRAESTCNSHNISKDRFPSETNK